MKNKKATIVTFQCVPNYGAVLQAYALQEVLKNYFQQVEILDYRPETLMGEYKLINFYSVPSVIATVWSSRKFLQKNRKFKSFQKKYLCLSEMKGKTVEKLQKYYTDYYFLGSDQIWNPDITHGFDDIYFGKVGNNTLAKCISYAASIGRNNYSKEELEKFSELLKGIDNISVREQEAAKILEDTLGVKSDVVVDPTILAGKDCFEKLLYPVPEKKYLFVYSLTGNPETQALAEKISRYYELPIVEISGRRKSFIRKTHRIIYNAGPEEFLSYIRNAQYVVTDSFHGTVFSILFHRKFNTIPHKTRGGRMQTLLDMAGLTERLTNSFDREIVEKEIEWKQVEQNLSLARIKSEKFIEKAVL